MSNIELWEKPDSRLEIKKIYAEKLTDLEFTIFVQMGKALDLNPFLREIWAVKYSGSAQIFIGRDGYRRNAQRYPLYDHHIVDAVYSNDSFEVNNGEVSHKYNIKDRGALKGAYCSVLRKGAARAVYTYVELSEYYTGQSLWKSKPATMIKKVAEAQALRMAFQELFAGTYDESEDFTELKEPKSYAPRTKAETEKTLEASVKEKEIEPKELDPKNWEKHIKKLMLEEAKLRQIPTDRVIFNLIYDDLLALDNNTFSYNDKENETIIRLQFDNHYPKDTTKNDRENPPTPTS